MRKSYVKPVMAAEQFVANEYVSTCWWGPCNANGYVFNDHNSNGTIDDGDTFIYKNIPCTGTWFGDDGFFIKTEGETQPPTNALVFYEYQLKEEYGKIKVKNSYKSSGTRAWYYDEKGHTSTALNKQKRPGRS